MGPQLATRDRKRGTHRPPDGSFVCEKSRHGPGEGAQPGSGGSVAIRFRCCGADAVARFLAADAVRGVVRGRACLRRAGVPRVGQGRTSLWLTLPNNPGWLDGSLWWVAVTAAAGVLVGVLRRVFRLPMKLPGTVQELKDQRVDRGIERLAAELAVPLGGCLRAADGNRARRPRCKDQEGRAALAQTPPRDRVPYTPIPQARSRTHAPVPIIAP